LLGVPEANWLAEAEDLQNETLVFLVRRTRDAYPDLYAGLFRKFSKRLTRLARLPLRGLDRTTGQEIVLKVEIDIMVLVLAEKPSRKSEFLEVAFAQAVERRTVNLIEKHKNSPLGHHADILPGAMDEDGDDIERPIELAPDDGPGPEEILLELWDEDLRDQLIQKVCDAVKDPQDLEAFLLHYRDGVPITSTDPAKENLVRDFQETEGQIKHRLSRTMKVIRRRLGVKK